MHHSGYFILLLIPLLASLLILVQILLSARLLILLKVMCSFGFVSVCTCLVLCEVSLLLTSVILVLQSVFRSVNEWRVIPLAHPHTHQYLFKTHYCGTCKIYMARSLHTNTSPNVLSYPFANNSFAASCWVFIHRNLLHFFVFRFTSLNVLLTCLLSKTSL